MTRSDRATLTLPAARELVVTRAFDLPPELVFAVRTCRRATKSNR
jgi:hypothetical protein